MAVSMPTFNLTFSCLICYTYKHGKGRSRAAYNFRQDYSHKIGKN